MADWPICLSWVLDSEDRNREYKTVLDPVTVKPGDSPEVAAAKRDAKAVSGVNSYYWPAQFAGISSSPYKEDRARMVEAFYRRHFWNQCFMQLESDEVAKRVLDFSVNGGSTPAVKCLQRAVLTLWAGSGTQPEMDVDGKWGPATLAQVNGCDPLTLVAAFQNQRIAYYTAIGGKNLPGWLARAKK